MKHLLLAACLLITLPVFCQLGASGGLGMSSKGNVLKLSVQYEVRNKVGISAGLLAHMDSYEDNASYFPIEAFVPIRVNENFRLVPHGGWAYKIKSLDDTDKNNGCFAYGMDLDWGISQRSTVTFGLTMMYDKYTEKIYEYNERYEFQKMFTLTNIERPLFFTIGFRYSFGQPVEGCD